MTSPEHDDDRPKFPLDELGTIIGDGNTRRVELNRILPFPIKDVWHALIDEASVALWFTTASIEPYEGGQITLTFGKTIVTGRIQTYLPPHVLSYTWEQEGETPSLVHFDLVEIGPAATRLTVIQTALDTHITQDVATGWHVMLERLKHHMQTGDFVPLDKNREKEIFAAYQASL